ncbi:S-adenosyl-L-methionine-dependent methyltransferase [Basidiobolus meristosporus CBS 931.73]|uniref:S-adenosyl-L-methionine-dependent methyltransferase n=1 Tax=Basidiobolus meristosporus CBS 931.73 TaxID=1314790 RepID=A0A1Y1Y8H7_9FUNG|nr:S-adenosyl-L-methionine-dependent methyltransferase [Basidiobolus meristosporus CBS 931.73]|eukprot:ORX94320.1 S-adenosyl-L-methionine-dependent methyltransferase [Basidiobolus meristosporus CBS 931.73]
MSNRKQRKEQVDTKIKPTPPAERRAVQVDPELLLSNTSLALVTLVNLATLTFISRRGASYTEPLYGNIFSRHLYNEVTLSCLVGGFALGYFSKFKGSSIPYCYSLIGVLLSCTYTPGLLLLSEADTLGPWIAPHVYQAFFVYPICFLVGLTSSSGGRTFAHLLSPSMEMFKSILYLWGVLILINKWGDLFRFDTTCDRTLLLASISTFLSLVLKWGPSNIATAPKKPASLMKKGLLLAGTILAISSIYYTNSYVAQCQRGVSETLHNRPESEWSIVAREENNFGWVSVVEEPKDRNIRVMKAGHSLIGGIYLNTNESIFGSFYFMEAALDLKRPQSGQEKALQIGLGIGVSASSLLQKGVEVDVVEINPTVYQYARNYFQLPTPTQVYLQDGRGFIETAPTGHYDYVLHDVFTGGSVPPSLFTQEALLHIKRILKPDGILALNFVGSPSAPGNLTMAHITHTLKQVFPEILCFTEGEERHTLHNLVYFGSQYPLRWRKNIQEDDPINMRAEMMSQLRYNPRWKVDTTYDSNFVSIITDRSNPLPNLQTTSSWEHWKACLLCRTKHHSYTRAAAHFRRVLLKQASIPTLCCWICSNQGISRAASNRSIEYLWSDSMPVKATPSKRVRDRGTHPCAPSDVSAPMKPVSQTPPPMRTLNKNSA